MDHRSLETVFPVKAQRDAVEILLSALLYSHLFVPAHRVEHVSF